MKNKNAVPYNILNDIKFKSEKNTGTEVYSPSHLAGFMIAGKIYHSCLIKAANDAGIHSNEFLELLIDGDVRLYRYETIDWAITPPNNKIVKHFLLKVGQEIPQSLGGRSFRDVVSEYFSDYPPLSEKIKNGQYKAKHIRQIVEEYNSRTGQ